MRMGVAHTDFARWWIIKSTWALPKIHHHLAFRNVACWRARHSGNFTIRPARKPLPEGRRPPSRLPLPRLPSQDEYAAGGEHAAVTHDHADVRVVDLGGRLAADLPDALLDGEHAVHPGVGVGQAAAVGVQRQHAARLRIALGDERARLALLDEAERLKSVDRDVR